MGRPARWDPACNALSKERDLGGWLPWDTRASWEECSREDVTSQGTGTPAVALDSDYLGSPSSPATSCSWDLTEQRMEPCAIIQPHA